MAEPKTKTSSDVPKSRSEYIDSLSDDEVRALYASEKIKKVESSPNEDKPSVKIEPYKSALISMGQTAGFGLLPAAIGAGSGLKALISGKEFKPEYERARKSALEVIAESEKQNPKASLAGTITGVAPTIPLVAGKGVQALKGAVGLGALSGGGTSISEGEDLKGVIKGAGIGAGVGAVTQGASEVVSKVPAALQKYLAHQSGISEKAIQIYKKSAEQIDDLIKKYGPNTPQAFNEFRLELRDTVKAAKEKWSEMISSSLDSIGKDIKVSTRPLISSIEKSISKADDILNSEEIAILKKEINLIKERGPDGYVTPRQANSLRERLTGLAEGAYSDQGSLGKLKNAGIVERAAKSAAHDIGTQLKSQFPEFKEAFKNYSELYDLDDALSSSVTKDFANEAAISGAGSGTNQAQREVLKRIGDLTGGDFVSKAEQLSAYKTFQNPNTASMFPTGRATLPFLLGGAAGGAYGGNERSAGMGALIGAGLTTPAAVKYLIKGQRAVQPALDIGSKALSRGAPPIKAFSINAISRKLNEKRNK